MTPILGIWASQGRVAGTSFESIATVTVGSGGSSSVDFTSIPATYSHLQVRGIARNTTNTSGTNNLRLRLNGVTTANYPWHYLEGDGSSASANASTTETGFFQGRITISDETASSFGAVVMDILDYTSTNKNKTVRTLTGKDLNGSGYIGLYSGVTTSSISAVTSITLYPQGGNFAQYSHFALYGIRSA